MTKLFTLEGLLEDSYREICLDVTYWDQHSTFCDYLKSQGVSWDEAVYADWLDTCEQSVINQLKYYAFLIYRRLTVKDNWGDMGRQQIDGSFSRLLLDLRFDESLTFQQVQSFQDILKEAMVEHGILDWSESQLDEAFDDLSIELLGRKFFIQDFSLLNRCIRFLGSDIFIQGGVYGLDKEFMAGRGYSEQYGDYTCVTLDSEIVRSPHTIIPMAAVIGDQDVFIRMESLRTIFYLKWVGATQYWDVLFLSGDHNRLVSEGVKKECVRRYCDMTSDGLVKSMDVFVSDLRETVMFHELGHGVIQHHLLPIFAGALGETSKVVGENGVTALLEFLADFSPVYKSLKGPMQNMIDIAQTDVERAERLFWMYVSDTWFFDTEDVYMYVYSDMMALCFVHVVREDKSIDWDTLQDMIGTADSVTGTVDLNSEGMPCLVRFAIDWVVSCTEEWRQLMESATYTLKDKAPQSFDSLYETVCEDVRSEWTAVEPFDLESYMTVASVWSQIFEYFSQSSDKIDAYHEMVKDQDSRLKKAFFATILSPEDQETYRDDLHQYVLDQFFAKNVCKK